MVLVTRQMCPTCFKETDASFEIELDEKSTIQQSASGEWLVMHQCQKCRDMGREVDPDKVLKVLSGELPPFPDIDENYTLSNLIDDLLKGDE